MDRFSAEDRSKIMSQVKNKNTKPELKIRKFLFFKGYRYRINVKNLPGCPDIVLPKYKTVIFVNGCFWHGHSNCKRAKLPQSNSDFWEKKILSNIARDKSNHALLESMGWNVVVIWSCEINQLIKFGTVEKLLPNSDKKKPILR